MICDHANIRRSPIDFEALGIAVYDRDIAVLTSKIVGSYLVQYVAEFRDPSDLPRLASPKLRADFEFLLQTINKSPSIFFSSDTRYLGSTDPKGALLGTKVIKIESCELLTPSQKCRITNSTCTLQVWTPCVEAIRRHITALSCSYPDGPTRLVQEVADYCRFHADQIQSLFPCWSFCAKDLNNSTYIKSLIKSTPSILVNDTDLTVADTTVNRSRVTSLRYMWSEWVTKYVYESASPELLAIVDQRIPILSVAPRDVERLASVHVIVEVAMVEFRHESSEPSRREEPTLPPTTDPGYSRCCTLY